MSDNFEFSSTPMDQVYEAQVADKDGGNPRTILASGPPLSELNKQQPVDTVVPPALTEPVIQPSVVQHPSDKAIAESQGKKTQTPVLKIGEFSWPCRQEVPAATTASVQVLMGKVIAVSKTAANPDGTLDMAKVNKDEIIALLSSSTDFFELAMSIVSPEHRPDFKARWTGEYIDPNSGAVVELSKDQFIKNPGDLMPAVIELLPYYTAASPEKA